MGRVLCALIVLLLLVLISYQIVMVKRKYHQAREMSRELWMDHVIWTRLYIISEVERLPDKDATSARLMKNQSDLGNMVAMFYGQQAGDRVTALLKDHIKIASDIVVAARDKDNGGLATGQKAWAANAEEIAQLLASATGAPICAMRFMMKKHLDTTTKEVVDRVGKNFTAEVQDFEDVKKHILMMSDVLVDCIFRQQHPLLYFTLVD